jgi:hypothetical protein
MTTPRRHFPSGRLSRRNYVWEALQGAIVEAEILTRFGFDPFNWSNKRCCGRSRALSARMLFPPRGMTAGSRTSSISATDRAS